jgi:hypothetical protein
LQRLGNHGFFVQNISVRGPREAGWRKIGIDASTLFQVEWGLPRVGRHLVRGAAASPPARRVGCCWEGRHAIFATPPAWPLGFPRVGRGTGGMRHRLAVGEGGPPRISPPPPAWHWVFPSRPGTPSRGSRTRRLPLGVRTTALRLAPQLWT